MYSNQKSLVNQLAKQLNKCDTTLCTLIPQLEISSSNRMNLDQTKLSRSEWDSIEIPVAPEELGIIKMIKNGYYDVNIRYNDALSLAGYLKVNVNDAMTYHLYETYMYPDLRKALKIAKMESTIDECFGSSDKKKMKKHKPISNADKYRLENSKASLEGVKSNIFEYVLIDELSKMLNLMVSKKGNGMSKTGFKKGLVHFYTINALIEYNVAYKNDFLMRYLRFFTDHIKEQITPRMILRMAAETFEKNSRLLQFADQGLYPHQKKLFTLIKQDGPKLILYTAPTGTGKTMSPIGLTEGKKVIFVCAARHVGLALAKAALSVGKKIAFAFGCASPDDVKLHYSAAKVFIKDWRTGGIRKVDNSVGDKVEMIISDVHSYLSAMHYMMAFTEDLNDIVMYWDEPTISLDYESHSLHDLISRTWRGNMVPNIVLSSATLPTETDLSDMLDELRGEYKIHTIMSHDSKKTIPLLNSENQVEMPHYTCSCKDEFISASKHCLTHNSLMRYLDIGEASTFILLALKFSDWFENTRNDKDWLEKEFNSVFPDIESVTLLTIKQYYCRLLARVREDQIETMQAILRDVREQKFKSTIHLVTTDAHTIKDGPAIYLANDVVKVADVYLKEANIREGHLKDIMHAIHQNNRINDKVRILQNSIEDKLKLNESKEKKQDIDNHQLNSDTREALNTIANLQDMIKVVSLDDVYVPNKKAHLNKYASDETITGRPFCSDIPEGVVEEIMMIDGIDDKWKILLMMGIGVFVQGLNNDYLEIMKDLADTQQLYLIIASTDYIYGTNYQFFHGYIGKDLANMSQEKCIQALGRVGRNKLQYEYSVRFRCDSLIHKLFHPDVEKPEAKNMNRLFRKVVMPIDN